jgi:hypothetical protein
MFPSTPSDALARRRERFRALYRAGAAQLRQDPDRVLALARRTLRWLEQDPHATFSFPRMIVLAAPVDA